jgi:hypothetical protein
MSYLCLFVYLFVCLFVCECMYLRMAPSLFPDKTGFFFADEFSGRES